MESTHSEYRKNEVSNTHYGAFSSAVDLVASKVMHESDAGDRSSLSQNDRPYNKEFILEGSLEDARLEKSLYLNIISDAVEALKILTRQLKHDDRDEENQPVRLDELHEMLIEMNFSRETIDEFYRDGIDDYYYSSSLSEVVVTLQSLVSACQMVQDNNQITAREYTIALDDLHQRMHELRLEQYENKKLTLVMEGMKKKWKEEKSCLKRDLQQARKEKKLLVEEVKKLRKETETQFSLNVRLYEKNISLVRKIKNITAELKTAKLKTAALETAKSKTIDHCGHDDDTAESADKESSSKVSHLHVEQAKHSGLQASASQVSAFRTFLGDMIVSNVVEPSNNVNPPDVILTKTSDMLPTNTPTRDVSIGSTAPSLPSTSSMRSEKENDQRDQLEDGECNNNGKLSWLGSLVSMSSEEPQSPQPNVLSLPVFEPPKRPESRSCLNNSSPDVISPSTAETKNSMVCDATDSPVKAMNSCTEDEPQAFGLFRYISLKRADNVTESSFFRPKSPPPVTPTKSLSPKTHFQNNISHSQRNLVPYLDPKRVNHFSPKSVIDRPVRSGKM
eukprot:CAMPEP_0195524622 /NCGR_PEP_ID=MMETSP0794_2-20130614/24542_1 /TAXON_ID=515487 /ORGANISM="Stephanopyxis turris, Strain CCMP 815" /LENGTH=561 /DNA_ID=CAMNT_0040654877 /DNA_START=67 /DNA_END=1752 /DNA_ORIENTATION=+